MTIKGLFLTLVVGVAVWALIDFLQTRQLESMLHKRLETRLEGMARLDRTYFDQHLRVHSTVAKIITTQERFTDYLKNNANEWTSAEEAPAKIHKRMPPWFPKISLLRPLAAVRYVLLLDGSGQLRELYQYGPKLPESFFEALPFLRLQSEGQAMMTAIDGSPFLLVTESIQSKNGLPPAGLMVVAPIDRSFLLASQAPFPEKGHHVALVDRETQVVLASNDMDHIIPGTPIFDLRRKYLVKGQSFFDYGASDLQVKFVTLISTAEVGKLNQEIITIQRRHLALAALAILAAIYMLMWLITHNIDVLAQKIQQFSQQAFGIHLPPLKTGDQLHLLEERFHYFADEIVRMEAKLREASITDDLTGLLNRRGFMTLARKQLQIAGRTQTAMYLLYTDLDNLKWINDHLGHSVGDQALMEFAALFKDTFRQSDIIARIGGDEFVVLLTDSAETPGKKSIVERFEEKLTLRNSIQGRSYRLLASSGVVQYDPAAPTSLDELLSRADSVMYGSKQKKREQHGRGKE